MRLLPVQDGKLRMTCALALLGVRAQRQGDPGVNTKLLFSKSAIHPTHHPASLDHSLLSYYALLELCNWV